MERVIIGSSNPVKTECTRQAFRSVFPGRNFHFQGIESDTGVSDQPMGETETLLGAENRSGFAEKKFPDADYWIGIEGGLEKIGNKLFTFAWVVVKGKTLEGKARTAAFELPSSIKELIEQGYELGLADDLIFKRTNSKHNDGTVGKLTRGTIDRVEFYKHALILALIPFINEEIY